MRFLVTAGPTREHLDPVRFLSNPSTGKMGFAVARAAAARGHAVTLVAGPVALKTPPGVARVDVTSAREMLAACEAALADGTVVVATAAVADWRPAVRASRKLKKREMRPELRLVRNPDILRSLRSLAARRRLSVTLVGFAAETDRVLEEAARKCREKGLAFIVANDVTEPGCGFGTETNRAVFLTPDGRALPQPLMTKRALAARIVRFAEGRCGR